MLNASKIFRSFVKSSNQRELDKIKSTVEKINAFEPQLKEVSREYFTKKTSEFKSKIKNGIKLDDLLPESFALVREAARRTLGERPYDVQLMGGIILHQGKIAEMKTGEGKTLVATLPVYLNALAGNGVHIVTVNDYLAKRDSEWMGKIYNFLGLSVGCITNNLNEAERKKAYSAEVTYGTNNEFGFDFLRDQMIYNINQKVQRDHFYCIVDEVDSILIDEARTPLVISGALEDKSDQYFVCNKFVKKLDASDYEIDEKEKTVLLSNKGIDKIEEISKSYGILKNNNFYDPQNINLVHHINQALKANLLFSKDTDYIVKDNKIELIDMHTGRILPGRRFSDGLMQAIEAKENVEIQSENQTLATITYQNYFRLYAKLSGMTGTALTEAEEFFDIYRLKAVSVPTNEKMIRKDLNDQIFRTDKEKYRAIISKIKKCYKEGQPILVGTISIEKSEKISEILKGNSIKHNVLNAKHHEQEARIIAEAGRLGAITIATNMAGRGTDIQLGGSINKLIDSVNDSNNSSEVNIAETKNLHAKEKQEVIKKGGLFVIGTERHESRRIDNQLRGRSGRQGDPGSSIFYISLEDDLMRIFGSESIDKILQKFGLKEDESIDHPWINKALERAQQKVESRNFDIRKTLLQFDSCMNDQRQVVYGQRAKILNSENVDEIISTFLDELCLELGENKTHFEQQNQIMLLKPKIQSIFGRLITNEEIEKIIKLKNDKFSEFIKNKFNEKKEHKKKVLSVEASTDLEKNVLLQILDILWRSHLQYLEQLRQVIGLRSYGQKNPLDEFQKEAFKLFEGLINKVKVDVIVFLSNLSLQIEEIKEKKNIDEKNAPITGKKIPRNSPCPCGSGKKYKHCCGAL